MSTGEMRRSMAAGVAFVVLFVVGVMVVLSNYPDIKEHDSAEVAAAKYVEKLSRTGTRAGLLVGAYLLFVAALAFVWFTRGLASRLTSSEAAGRLVQGLGTLGATAVAVGGVVAAGVAGDVSFGSEPLPKDGDAIRIVMELFFPLVLIVFALACAAIIAAVAVKARGSRLPAWLGYSAWLAVLGGIFGFIFMPMALVALWFLAAAINGVLAPSPSA